MHDAGNRACRFGQDATACATTQCGVQSAGSKPIAARRASSTFDSGTNSTAARSRVLLAEANLSRHRAGHGAVDRAADLVVIDGSLRAVCHIYLLHGII